MQYHAYEDPFEHISYPDAFNYISYAFYMKCSNIGVGESRCILLLEVMNDLDQAFLVSSIIRLGSWEGPLNIKKQNMFYVELRLGKWPFREKFSPVLICSLNKLG